MEYERSRRIDAKEDAVFDFVNNLQTMPDYVPTMESIERIDDERVRVRGSVNGEAYEDVGWLKTDRDRHRMEWRVERMEYSGSLRISGLYGASEVVVHLSLPPHTSPSGRPLTGEQSDEPDPIEASLEAAMDSLRNLLEGTGGKERPASTGSVEQ